MVPSRRVRFSRSVRLCFALFFVGGCVAVAGGKHNRSVPTPPPAGSENNDLKNIPLTVGHEAKGLVLPNYDAQGHLVGRFEAATAARLDENHVHFSDLRMQGYDEHEQPNVNVVMADAVLDLETRVIKSNKRTQIKRADFEIAGDAVVFNTATHHGKLTGNVHMTIFNQKELTGAPAKP